jgi:predicted RNA-binding protein with EMAP domain
MVYGKFRSKTDQLVEALNGKLTYHHRFLLKHHLENIAFMAEQIQELDEEIQERMIPFSKGVQSDSDHSRDKQYCSIGNHS